MYVEKLRFLHTVRHGPGGEAELLEESRGELSYLLLGTAGIVSFVWI